MGKQADKVARALAQEEPLYDAMLSAVRDVVGDDFVNRTAAAAPGVSDNGTLLSAIQTSYPEPIVRKRLANRAAALFPPTPASRSDALSGEGLAFIPPLLEQDQLVELRDYLASQTHFEIEGRLQKHPVSVVVNAPHVLEIATNPALLALAAGFLGCAPTIVNIEGWWSPASGVVHGPEQLHRDKDDFRACKVFMYLTDVATEDGPHEYAIGSSDPSYVRDLLAVHGRRPEEIRDVFAVANTRSFVALNEEIFAKNLVRVVGPAGTCFVTNSSGMHRGVPPARGKRGMIAITFGFIGYPHRLYRFAPVEIQPPANDLARHALRLLY